MKMIFLALLFFVVYEVKAQADKNLAATGIGDLRFIIGIIIAVIVIVAMYILLRKEDK